MISRAYRPGDASTLRNFPCSSGAAYEDEVERWINSKAIAWLNDVPRATFQRRGLHLVEDSTNQVVAVFAWQDIVEVPTEGIWLQVLAVAVGKQHHGLGRATLAIARAEFVTLPREGDALAAYVDHGNARSRAMLTADGWTCLRRSADGDLMVGHL